jgi:hypothetical protein
MAYQASQVLKNLAKKIEKYAELKGDGFEFLVDEIPLRIIRRTLQGKDENNKPLKPLSAKYILARWHFKKRGEMGLDASISKSNLTLTGQMLSSIIGARTGSKFTFTFSNVESDKKAYYARTTGRPFFNLSPTDKKGLLTKISAIIRKNLREIKGDT